MTEFVSEKEQLEQLKKWWNDWGKYLGLAIIIGIIVGFGWRYWHRMNTQKEQNASVIYGNMVNAILEKNDNLSQQYANQLTNNYDRTPYAAFAALLEAKQAVTNNQFPVALQKLQWIIDHAEMNSLKQIARLRTARILLAEQKPQAALTTLKTVNDKTYQPMVYYIQGEAYQQLGNASGARKAFEAAKNGLLDVGVNDPIIDMKLAEPQKG